MNFINYTIIRVISLIGGLILLDGIFSFFISGKPILLIIGVIIVWFCQYKMSYNSPIKFNIPKFRKGNRRHKNVRLHR